MHFSGCSPGYYNDETNKAVCKDCPEGYYCYTNTTDYTPNECPSGCYCPLNTPDPYAYPCPPGTFNNLTVQQSDAACVDCTPGMYCAGYGNSAPTAECSPGWYCSGGANESMVSGWVYDLCQTRYLKQGLGNAEHICIRLI